MYLRRLAAAALAVPVLVGFYAPFLSRRRVAMPLAACFMILALVAVGIASLAQPAATVGTPPTPTSPLTSSKFTATVGVNHAPREGVVVQFTAPMDQASVAAALQIDPPATVEAQWNDTSTQLVLVPTTGSTPGTYYTVTVGAGAMDAQGNALSAPARTAFLVRSAARATLSASKTVGDRVPGSAYFQVSFDQPVDVESATAALRVTPTVKGRVSAVTGDDGTQVDLHPAGTASGEDDLYGQPVRHGRRRRRPAGRRAGTAQGHHGGRHEGRPVPARQGCDRRRARHGGLRPI